MNKYDAITLSRPFFIPVLLLGLAACGGGGGPATEAPPAPELKMQPQAVKTLHFTWNDVEGETEYRLQENPDGVSGFNTVATLDADSVEQDWSIFLPDRVNARYLLQACNAAGCSDSNEVSLDAAALTQAIGYLKAGNAGVDDRFGHAIAVSGDGTTLAVGAAFEDSAMTGVIQGEGNAQDDDAPDSGAVYVFVRDGTQWRQQAYIKASNGESEDYFGVSVAISDDGQQLVVGASGEDGNGVAGQNDNSMSGSGAVYVFTRNAAAWSQSAYLKASSPDQQDYFGRALALSGDGGTLAVGAYGQVYSGAAYVFIQSVNGWVQQAHVEPSNMEVGDLFGSSLALSENGNLLAVGAPEEDGDGSDPDNNAASGAGAVYVFQRQGSGWSQEAYIKAETTTNLFQDSIAGDHFGAAVALSASGNRLAVGAQYEDSVFDTTPDSGAVYVFDRYALAANIVSWEQQAYIKPLAAIESEDRFGGALSLSADGRTLAVGVNGEDSSSIGLNGDESDNSRQQSGAAYLFKEEQGEWSQKAYIKASNTAEVDVFGASIALSADGSVLAIGAGEEDGEQDAIGGSGAVYLY